MTIEIARFASPIGPLGLAAREGRLAALWFVDGRGKADRWLERRFGSPVETRASKDPAGAITALRAYFDGDVRAIDRVAVDLGGGGFMRRAWEALRDIPAGGTTSYGALAKAAGSPEAVRAAGTACGANPVAIVVPCHRVVRSDGSLGGYGGGLEVKTWLLEHERRHAGAGQLTLTA